MKLPVVLLFKNYLPVQNVKYPLIEKKGGLHTGTEAYVHISS